MHELSIAVCLIDLACEELRRLGPVRPTALHVRVGQLSGVVKEALMFSFDAAATGTPIEGTRLQIEDVPVTVWCPACALQRTLDTVTQRRCPVCDERTPEIVSGEELELVGLEIVDA